MSINLIENLQITDEDLKNMPKPAGETDATKNSYEIDADMTQENIAQFFNSESVNHTCGNIDDNNPLNASDHSDDQVVESEDEDLDEEYFNDFKISTVSKQKPKKKASDVNQKKSVKEQRAKNMVRYEKIPMYEFDEQTKYLLRRMVHARYMGRYHHIIGTGSRSLVLYGHCCTCVSVVMPWEACVKVYETDKKNSEAVNQRVQNEFKNLDRMYRCKINCPKPVCAWRNLIMMGAIGYGSTASSIMEAPPEFINRNYLHVIDSMKRMYQIAKVVHGNLSPKSILWSGQPYFISLSHSVPADHPKALKLLMKDCYSVTNMFKELGDKEVKASDDLFKFVTDLPEIEDTILEYLKILKPTDVQCESNSYNSLTKTGKALYNYKDVLEFCTKIHR